MSRTTKPNPSTLTSVRAIKRARGIIKRKPGDPSFADEWAEHKRQEREFEQRKFAFATARPKRKSVSTSPPTPR